MTSKKSFQLTNFKFDNVGGVRRTKKLVAAANDVDEVVLKKTEPGKKEPAKKKLSLPTSAT